MINQAKLADQQKLTFHNTVHIDHYRNGVQIGTYEFPNGITVQGKNRLENVMFYNTTQITTWYTGLIDAGNAVVLSENDVYAGVNTSNGWKEFQSYTISANATIRGTWGAGAAVSKAITNASPIVYDITANGTVYGVFVCGGLATANLKADACNDANGCLWATANFTSGNVAVLNGDQLKVTYTVSA
jgi:hypothetical protein